MTTNPSPIPNKINKPANNKKKNITLIPPFSYNVPEVAILKLTFTPYSLMSHKTSPDPPGRIERNYSYKETSGNEICHPIPPYGSIL
jgi:hypothetical protein